MKGERMAVPEQYQVERECDACDGMGVIENKCFEDTCCCADTSDHGDKDCWKCGGKCTIIVDARDLEED